MIRYELNLVRTNEGGIPIISAIVHSIDRLNLFSMGTKHSTCPPLRSTAIIARVSHSCQILKCGGSDLSSNFGDSSIDGFAVRD